MFEKNTISNSRIANSKEVVKGEQAMNKWKKEQLEKYESRGLKGKNIPEYGEYRVFFTRKTLENEFKDLNYKEKMLRLAFELFRSKKTNIAYPPFRILKKLTGMSKDTLIRTILSLEKKKVFKVDRRNGNNNIYHFS